jgi:predicted ArsR family transcriptional regulator
LDEGLRHFLEHWVSGLMAGLEGVDERARAAILRECGKACARSFTAEVFREAKRGAGDLDSFLAALAQRFPGATYEMLGPGEIRVQYASCACDLVEQGLTASPLLCECSAHNLQENFEQALGVPVTVALKTTILQGSDRCRFLVSLKGDG